MILKNRRTRESLEIEYSEFRKKFAKEIETAFESYRKTQLNKYLWSLIFILNYNGILTILEIQIGILEECKIIFKTRLNLFNFNVL